MSDDNVADALNGAEVAGMAAVKAAEQAAPVVKEVVPASVGSRIDGALSDLTEVVAFVQKHKGLIEALSTAAEGGAKAPVLGMVAKALFAALL